MLNWLFGNNREDYYDKYITNTAKLWRSQRELVIANRALARKSSVIKRLKSYLKEYEKKYGKLNDTDKH